MVGVNNTSSKLNATQILSHPKEYVVDTTYEDDCIVHMTSSPACSKHH